MKTKSEKPSNTNNVIVDSSLEKYEGKVLFPEKLAKANEMLRTIGIPKDFRHQKAGKALK